MIDDAQYEYLINFFDAGSLDRLKRDMKGAERAIDQLSRKAEGLQKITESLGFGANPKAELAGLGYVRTGGKTAATRNADLAGNLARRRAEQAQILLTIEENDTRLSKRLLNAKERAATKELANLERSEFLNRQVNTIKEAEVKVAAARLRTAQAFRAELNAPALTAASSPEDVAARTALTNRSVQAEADQAKVVAQYEKMTRLAKETSVIDTKRQGIQTKIEASKSRMNAATKVGNTLEAQRESLKWRQLTLDQRALSAEKMSTLEIAKQKAQQDRLNLAKAKFDQANSGPRQRDAAQLFKIQAQLLANYAAMGLALGTLAFAGKFVVELDREFAQLQAITATTDKAMGGLRDTIISVSEKTKFTALEVAEAATILGQAGFSTDAIESSIENITLLATAVGADLKTTVDLVTSTLSVFNLRAEEAGNVANVFTSAVNNSKLNLEKLTLGLQYAGNIANEQNISFSELTATLGAMANSGIRAGSTLGTGLRQIITALAAPSDKLNARLSDLGLTTADVDVKLHGFTGVLANLQDAGFTTADALEVLEVRAGAAFAALSNNASTITDLREKFLLSTAASEANSVQMESLANKASRLKSVFGTLAYKGLEPMLDLAKAATDALTFLLSVLNKAGPVVPILTSTLVALGTAFVIARLKTMLFTASMLTSIKTMVTTRITMARLAATAVGFKAALGPVGVTMLALTVASVASKSAFDALTVSVDELQAKLDESTGKFETYRQNMTSLDKEILRLTERNFEQADSMEEVKLIAIELQQKFGDLGAQFNLTEGDSSKLVDELERLKGVMIDLQQAELSLGLEDSKKLIEKRRRELGKEVSQKTRLGVFEPETLKSFNKVNQGDTSLEAVRDLFTKLSAQSGTAANKLNQTNGTRQTQDKLIEELTRKGTTYGLDPVKDREVLLRTERLNAKEEIEALKQVIDEMSPLFREVLAQDSRVKQLELAALQGNPEFKNFEFERRGLNEAFTKAKGANDKDAIEALIPQVQALGEEAKEAFKNQKEAFSGTGFGQEIAGLEHSMELALKQTDAQIKEQNELYKLRLDAEKAELDNLLKGEKVSEYGITRGVKRENILQALAEKQALERSQLLAEQERSNKSQKLKNAELEALGRSEAAERLKITEAFKKSDLARDLKGQEDGFKMQAQALQSSLAKQKKLVDSDSSVRDIKLAKDKALLIQEQIAEAERAQLRFDLRHEAHNLPFQLEQLNIKLANKREVIADSFDKLHEEIKINQTPKLRDALTKLVDSFDEARQAFDQKLLDLQNPVKAAEAARGAMDATAHKGKFSDVHRRQMDKKVEQAKITAMQQELELLRKERTVDLETQKVALEAQNLKIDTQIAAAQQTLDNYNGGDNSSSMEEAKAAAAQLNELNSLQSKVQGEILDKKKEIASTTEEILDLEREIGIQTGTSAPAQYTWTEGLVGGLQEYLDKLEEATLTSDTFADKVVEVGDVMTDSLGDAFYDIAIGAKSVGEAFGDMAEAILKAILKILAEQVAIFAIKQMFAAFGFTPQSFASGGQVSGSGLVASGPVYKNPFPTGLGFARGGVVPNLGLTGRDAVPIMAQADEFILRNSAVESIGKEKLYAMNAMGAAALDNRGITAIAMPETGSNEVNVYVVSPEEKPQLGPKDVLYIIGKDIVAGGQTKQLIKKVALS